MSQQKTVRLGYNIEVTPLGSITATPTAAGTPKLTFRAEVKAKGGRTLERTIVAKGRAHDALAAVLKEGRPVVIRGFYDRLPANDDGSRGAEYITAIGLPKAA